MPAERSFSYEYLKRLVQEHPDWSHTEYAKALTDEVRARLRDPKYPMVKPNAVAAALHRYRPTWEEQGVMVPPRRGLGRAIPWVGIPEDYRMHTHLRKMRVLARIDAGESVEPRQARLALKFRRSLRERRQVLDLTPNGRPIVRPARADEVDGTGALLGDYARHPGLTESQWASMTPEERSAASARWIAGNTPAHLELL